MIGYLRDFGFKYNFIAESFETSLPWKDVSRMCTAVNKRIIDDCKGMESKDNLSYLTELPKFTTPVLLFIFTSVSYTLASKTQWQYIPKFRMPLGMK